MQLAATKGHTDIVSYLRGKRSEKESSLFNALNNYYYHGNDLAQITRLINQGVNIDARDDNYYAPLHWAFNKLDLVQLLVERGADLDAKGEHLWTTLHWAADSNQLDTVKYLVEKGADFNAKGKNSKTPYDFASEKNHSEVAEFLRPLRNRTALHHAAENGRLDVVKRLIKKGVDIKDSQNRTPLHYAAESGHLDVVKYLVGNGADVYAKDSHENGNNPRHLATIQGKSNVVEYLRDTETDINDFINAATSSSSDDVKRLINTVPNIDVRNEHGNTALHLAAIHDRLDTVKYLVEKGANIEAKDSNGWTALHYAATGSGPGRLETVKYLLGKGASVYAKNNEGNKPSQLATQADVVNFLSQEESSIWHLCNAAGNGNFNDVKNYASQVSSIDGRGEWGYTPLHCATDAGHLDIAKYLVERGANIEAKDSQGRTSLHWTAKSNRLDVVKYLLRLGANIDSKDNNGWTPLHWAADSGALSVVEYLSGHNEYEHKIPYRVADGTAQQHQVVRVQQLAKLAYLTGQKVSMCIDTYHSPSEIWIMEVSE